MRRGAGEPTLGQGPMSEFDEHWLDVVCRHAARILMQMKLEEYDRIAEHYELIRDANLYDGSGDDRSNDRG